MSLIHLRPARLKPGVHYVSAFFPPCLGLEDAAPVALARPERAAKGFDEKRSRAMRLAHQRRLEKPPPSSQVRVLCARLNLRLQCGEILLQLIRTEGAPLDIVALGFSPASVSTSISQIRRALPAGMKIVNTPGLGWAISPAQGRALLAIIEGLT